MKICIEKNPCSSKPIRLTKIVVKRTETHKNAEQDQENNKIDRQRENTFLSHRYI